MASCFGCTPPLSKDNSVLSDRGFVVPWFCTPRSFHSSPYQHRFSLDRRSQFTAAFSPLSRWFPILLTCCFMRFVFSVVVTRGFQQSAHAIDAIRLLAPVTNIWIEPESQTSTCPAPVTLFSHVGVPQRETMLGDDSVAQWRRSQVWDIPFTSASTLRSLLDLISSCIRDYSTSIRFNFLILCRCRMVFASIASTEHWLQFVACVSPQRHNSL